MTFHNLNVLMASMSVQFSYVAGLLSRYKTNIRIIVNWYLNAAIYFKIGANPLPLDAMENNVGTDITITHGKVVSIFEKNNKQKTVAFFSFRGFSCSMNSITLGEAKFYSFYCKYLGYLCWRKPVYAFRIYSTIHGFVFCAWDPMPKVYTMFLLQMKLCNIKCFALIT